MKDMSLAKEAIAQKDFKKLDDLWTEMVLDQQIRLNEFFEVTKELKKARESERALMLLEMLASHLESEKEYQKAIEVYKNMLYYSKDDTDIRKKLVRLYKTLFKESTHLNEYIEISGLNKGEPIFKTIKKLEEYLAYDIGKYFYFERYGMGEVIDTIPARREIVINFEKKERHFLTIDVARGLLTSIDTDHFLYVKHKNIGDLKKLSVSNPLELIKFMLKSFARPLTASQIKTYLEGIVEKEKINKWWEKIRKNLEKDDNIKVSGKTTKHYTYSESVVDKQEEAIAAFEKASPQEKYLLAEYYAKKMPGVFKQILPQLVELGNELYKKEPALALDIVLLCDDSKLKTDLAYTRDDILQSVKPENIIEKMNTFEHQRVLLQPIKERNPDRWIEVFKNLVFSIDNFKLFDEVANHLKKAPKKLRDFYHAIFSMSKQYPLQFQWMLRKMQSGDLQEYLSPRFMPKLIDSLNYVKGIKGIVSKMLSLEKFDAILQEAQDDEARRILESVNQNLVLADYEKKNFIRIIEYHFPHFFSKESDVIYSTEQALKKKKEELNRIITIEIPENKKEISRAREYGDLSENFEYKAAKERQDQLYQKVRIIEAELKNVQVIDMHTIDTSQVTVGTEITLKNAKTGKFINYTILGRWDTDLKKNIISNEAPVAQSLLGKVCGDKVTLNQINYEIVKIDKGI